MVRRARLLDLPGGPEEPLGLLQGRGVDAAGEDLARVGRLGVVGPGQPGDRVEQDDHVLAVLDHPLGLLDDHLGDLDVPRGRLVERRADDLGRRPLDRPLHVGDLLGPLVDQQDHHVGVGVVRQDAVGDLLEQDRLAGPRRGDDQAALAEADRA